MNEREGGGEGRRGGVINYERQPFDFNNSSKGNILKQ